MNTSPKTDAPRALLGSLKVENFRILQDFEVRKLGRVNLIVGKNNSGKSTVLEALRIYAGAANPVLLEQIAGEHNEKTRGSNDEAIDNAAELPFQNFFTGRVFPETDNIQIYIGENAASTKRFLIIQHQYFVEYQEETEVEKGDISFRTRRKFLSKSEALIRAADYPKQALSIIIDGTKNSGLIDLNDARRRAANISPYWDVVGAIPCSYIPTQFISVDDLANIWDNILFSDYADSVKQGLKIIAEDFEDLAFVKSEFQSRARTPRPEITRACKVKLKSLNRAVSLNSLGDGMLRVLQLLLKIYPAKGGFLLIDEFENGLHYSIQEKVWQLIFELAESLDIQVYATTHSWDCIESFAKVAVERTDVEGVLFRVGRSIKTSDNGKIISTVFEEDKLFSITQADVEVR